MAEQIKFTEDVEDAIKDHSLHQIEAQLAAKLERYTSVDTSSEDPGNSGSVERVSALLLFCLCHVPILHIYPPTYTAQSFDDSVN